MLYGKYTALNKNYMVRRIITAQFSSNIFFISRRKFQFGGYMPITPHEHFLAFSLTIFRGIKALRFTEMVYLCLIENKWFFNQTNAATETPFQMKAQY